MDGRLDVCLFGHEFQAFFEAAQTAVYAAEDDSGHGVPLHALAVFLHVQRDPPGELHQSDDEAAEGSSAHVEPQDCTVGPAHGLTAYPTTLIEGCEVPSSNRDGDDEGADARDEVGRP